LVQNIQLIACQPNDEDGRKVYAWRTDPATQAMFFTHMALDWEGFWPVWRDGYFSDTDLVPAFAVNEQGEPLGVVSFSRMEPIEGLGVCVDISINVAPEARGKGVGVQALRRVADYLQGRGVDTVIAVVKLDNPASAKSFENAGFVYHDETVHHVKPTGADVAVKRYVLKLNA